MLCVGGLGLYLWMFFEVSCPARRQTSHCLPAEAPPCCCEARPVRAGSAVLLWFPPALRQSLSVVAGCLGNGRLRQQWACISVGTGCLSNGWLPQQWACISVGVGCLGNGGCPPPQSVSDRLHGDCLKSWSCSSHWANPNALSLQSPGRAQCPSLAQSQIQPSQVSGCWLNRAPRQACPGGSDGQGRPPPPRLPASPGRPTAWHPVSFYTWEFPRSVGNKDQSGNAALTHRLRIQRGLPSWVVLTAPS